MFENTPFFKYQHRDHLFPRIGDHQKKRNYFWAQQHFCLVRKTRSWPVQKNSLWFPIINNDTYDVLAPQYLIQEIAYKQIELKPTLVIIAWVAAFSLPTVYAAKQKEVDALLATATTHYTNLNAKLAALVPQQQQAPPAKEE